MDKITGYFYDYAIKKYMEEKRTDCMEQDVDVPLLIAGLQSYIRQKGIDVGMTPYMDNEKKIQSMMRLKTIPFDSMDFAAFSAYFIKYSERSKVEELTKVIFSEACQRYAHQTIISEERYHRLHKELFEAAAALSDDAEHGAWLDYTISEAINDLRYAHGLQDTMSLRLKNFYGQGI